MRGVPCFGTASVLSLQPITRMLNLKRKVMANDVELTPLQWDLVKHANEEGNAAEELREAINSIISKYKLHPSLVLSLLARLSACYINLTQAIYKKKGDRECVLNDFLNMLTAHHLDHAIDDFKKEQEEMTKNKQGSDLQKKGS